MNVVVFNVASANEPPRPLIIDQDPVPTTALFAARVTVVVPQVLDPVWSGPALATVGFWWKVIFTSSNESVQGGLLTYSPA